jgi:hypothetical protein
VVNELCLFIATCFYLEVTWKLKILKTHYDSPVTALDH